MISKAGRISILLVAGLAAFFGLQLYIAHLDARVLEQRVAAANAMAERWEIRFNKASQTFEERGFTVQKAETLMDSLRAENEALAAVLGAQDATPLTLQSTETVVDTELADSASVAFRSDTMLVGIEHKSSWPESTLRVWGTVEVFPDSTAFSELRVRGELHQTVAVSRLPDTGELRVDVWYDTPDLSASEVMVLDYLGDPLLPERSLFGEMFDTGTLVTVGGVALGVVLLPKLVDLF